MIATTPSAQIIDLGADIQSVCWPNDAAGWPVQTPCGKQARYVAAHCPAGTTPAPTSGGSHQSLCAEHAREQLARCLRWACHGAS